MATATRPDAALAASKLELELLIADALTAFERRHGVKVASVRFTRPQRPGIVPIPRLVELILKEEA